MKGRDKRRRAKAKAVSRRGAESAAVEDNTAITDCKIPSVVSISVGGCRKLREKEPACRKCKHKEDK